MPRQPIRETNGFLLAQICKIRRVHIHTALESFGLYGGQQFILSVLWEREGITHSELAETLHIQPATVTNTLKRMEKAGLVQRRPDLADQRVSRVHLTDFGRSIQEPVETAWHDLEERTFIGFNLEERVLMRRLLLQMRDNLVPDGE